MPAIPDSLRTPHGLTDTLRRLLMRRRFASLGTINPDGSPQMTIVNFSLDASDRMHIPTTRVTRKVRNILDRPEATALVELEPGWVSCSGPARIIEGAEALDLNRSVYERTLTEAGMATIGRLLQAHEDATIEITPTKWMSWEPAAFMQSFKELGIDPGNPAEWMKDLNQQ